MKKILIVVALFLAIAAFALPPIIASQTESMLEQHISGDEAMRQYLDVKVSAFDKGYRHSTARLNVGLGSTFLEMFEAEMARKTQTPLSPAERAEVQALLDKTIELEVDIEHGPVLLDGGPGVGLNRFRATLVDGELIQLLEEFTGAEDILLATGTMSLTGGLHGNSLIKALRMKIEDGVVDFAGIDGDWHWTPGTEHLIVETKETSLKFTLDDATIALDGMALNIDSLLSNGYVSLGTGGFGVDSMRMRLTGADSSLPETVTIDGFSFDWNVKEGSASDLRDLDLRYQLTDLAAGEFTAADMSFTFAIRHIGKEVLERYQRISARAQMSEDSIASWQSLIYDALASSPIVQFGPLTATFNDESLTANAVFEVDATTLPPADEFYADDPEGWAALISANAKINASEGFVNLVADQFLREQFKASIPPDANVTDAQIEELVAQQRPMIMESLVGQGFTTLKDGAFSTVATFDEGELLINGTPFPLGPAMVR